jgi:hypothetical protein
MRVARPSRGRCVLRAAGGAADPPGSAPGLGPRRVTTMEWDEQAEEDASEEEDEEVLDGPSMTTEAEANPDVATSSPPQPDASSPDPGGSEPAVHSPGELVPMRLEIAELPDIIRDPPRRNVWYLRGVKFIKKTLGAYWPDGITLVKLCAELNRTAPRRLTKNRKLMGYVTWTDMLRSMPDVVRIDGSRDTGYSVFLMNPPKRKVEPVIDPENPPWWWRPEAPPYVPPGPQRMDRGLEEYEAFRNVVRSIISREPNGITLGLLLASKGLSGQKAKRMRRKTGFDKLVDLLRSMPDLIDFIEEPRAEGGYIVKAHDPSKPIPAPPVKLPLPAPPGAPLLPRGTVPKVEIYRVFRECVIWGLKNVFTPERFPNGVPLEHFCSGYGINGVRAKHLRLRLGYLKAADLIRSMPDLVTVLPDPERSNELVVKCTDPSTIPPDYDPMPRRFPSDPRVTRGNPLGSPLLPKGDMPRKEVFLAFRELFRWWASRNPNGLPLTEFCITTGLNGKKAKQLYRRLGFPRMGDLVRSMPDAVKVIPDPDVRGGWMVYPAGPADSRGERFSPSFAFSSGKNIYYRGKK